MGVTLASQTRKAINCIDKKVKDPIRYSKNAQSICIVKKIPVKGDMVFDSLASVNQE